MLKISEPSLNHTVILKIEGRLVGPWVNELRNACEQQLAIKHSLNLDVADVAFADQAGLNLLLCLRGQGVRLLNGSPFLEEELRSAGTQA